MPLTVVAVTVPCKVPVPALRAAVITRPLSVVTRLPAESSTRMTGCVANGTPAVAVDDGCIRIVSLLAWPTLTVIDGLVFAVLVLSVMSLAVRVCEPAVWSVTLIVGVPAFRSLYLKLALLEPPAIDTLEIVVESAVSRKAYVPPESLLRTTVIVASEVLGLLYGSWRCTVIIPEVAATASVCVEVVNTSLLAEAGVTVNWPLT